MKRRNFRALFAIFVFSSFLFLSPAVCPAQETGKTTELKITPGGSCEEELWEADRRCLNGRCEDAVYLYDRFLERDDACHGDLRGDAFFRRGRAKETMNDFRGAVSDYGLALQAKPDSAKFREALGRGYYKLANQKERLGDFRGALADYLKALELTPGLPEAADGVASIYLEIGNKKQERGELKSAMEDYEKALRYSPNHPAVREAKKNLEERLKYKAAERDAMFTF